MPTDQSEAIVLRTTNVGDQDKIAVFFCRDKGIVRGVAKGARKFGIVTSDYAPGGAAEVVARIRRDETDLIEVGYALRLVRSVNGISHDSRVQSAFAEGRLPLAGNLSAGAGWNWDERLTTYDTLRSVRRSASEWRAFASWTLR